MLESTFHIERDIQKAVILLEKLKDKIKKLEELLK